MIIDDLAVRPAEKADETAIVSMCKSSMEITYGAFLDREQMASWIDGTETDDYVRSTLGNMIVAVDGDGLCGVVAIRRHMIDLIWVAPDKRGRGTGKALMAAAEATIRTEGHATARLDVIEPNTDAIRFYEARGWSRREAYPDPVAGVREVVMIKSLVGARAPR